VLEEGLHPGIPVKFPDRPGGIALKLESGLVELHRYGSSARDNEFYRLEEMVRFLASGVQPEVLAGAKGFRNVGNSCYINASLQCLLNCEHLREHLLAEHWANEQHSITRELRVLARDQERNMFSDMAHFKKAVSRRFGVFEGTDQHDSQEFLTILLNTLANENGFPREFNIVEQCFRGEIQTTLECKSCRNRKFIREHFHTLSVPIPEHDWRYFRVCLVDSALGSVSYGLQLSAKELTLQGLLLALGKQLGLAFDKGQRAIAEVAGARILQIIDLTRPS
jgi:hypothetical protein